MFCHKCGQPAPPASEGAIFCPHCGSKLFTPTVTINITPAPPITDSWCSTCQSARTIGWTQDAGGKILRRYCLACKNTPPPPAAMDCCRQCGSAQVIGFTQRAGAGSREKVCKDCYLEQTGIINFEGPSATGGFDAQVCHHCHQLRTPWVSIQRIWNGTGWLCAECFRAMLSRHAQGNPLWVHIECHRCHGGNSVVTRLEHISLLDPLFYPLCDPCATKDKEGAKAL